MHHTQLLNRLVRDGRLVPVAPASGEAVPANAAVAGTVTYHDPCYLGRHNGVYSPPRELLGALPGVTFTEMPRHGARSFCCGAGGARMWMEEKLGTRINLNRTAEAVATGADTHRRRLPVLPGDAHRRTDHRAGRGHGAARASRWPTSPNCCSPPSAAATPAEPTPQRLDPPVRPLPSRAW